MNNSAILKVLNPVIGLLACSQALSGLFHKSLGHETFEVVHEGGGLALAAGILLHVILNRAWIKTAYFSGK